MPPSRGAEKERPRKGKWAVVVLQKAIDEGRKELNEGEYWHVVNILKKLSHYGNEAETSELSIRAIDGIFELREKGGLLGKKNMRFFFQVIPDTQQLVVVKTYRKDEEDQTPRHIVINAHTRIAQWRLGHMAVGAEYRTVKFDHRATRRKG